MNLVNRSLIPESDPLGSMSYNREKKELDYLGESLNYLIYLIFKIFQR